MQLLEKNILPDGFEYPIEFLAVIEHKLISWEPWQIENGNSLLLRYDGLKERYPKYQLIPFANRGDNDDIACWDIAIPGKVIIIHDFASQGWERRKIYDSFWDWFRQAIQDMVEWDR